MATRKIKLNLDQSQAAFLNYSQTVVDNDLLELIQPVRSVVLVRGRLTVRVPKSGFWGSASLLEVLSGLLEHKVAMGELCAGLYSSTVLIPIYHSCCINEEAKTESGK